MARFEEVELGKQPLTAVEYGVAFGGALFLAACVKRSCRLAVLAPGGTPGEIVRAFFGDALREAALHALAAAILAWRASRDPLPARIVEAVAAALVVGMLVALSDIFFVVQRGWFFGTFDLGTVRLLLEDAVANAPFAVRTLGAAVGLGLAVRLRGRVAAGLAFGACAVALPTLAILAPQLTGSASLSHFQRLDLSSGLLETATFGLVLPLAERGLGVATGALGIHTRDEAV